MSKYPPTKNPTKKQQSKYAPIWERLKAKEIVRLHVLPDDVYTVRRMVSKIKDEDLAFKMMQEVEQYFLVFRYDEAAEVLEIRLKARYGLFEKVLC